MKKSPFAVNSSLSSADKFELLFSPRRTVKGLRSFNESGSVHGFAPHFKKKLVTQRTAAEKYVVKSTPLAAKQSYVKSSPPASVSKDNVKNVSPQKSYPAVFESKEKVKKVSPTLQPVVESTVTRPNSQADEPQPSLTSKTPQTLSSEKSPCVVPSLMDITFSREKVFAFEQFLQQKYHRTASVPVSYQIASISIPLCSIINNLHHLMLYLTRQFNLPITLPILTLSHHPSLNLLYTISNPTSHLYQSSSTHKPVCVYYPPWGLKTVIFPLIPSMGYICVICITFILLWKLKINNSNNSNNSWRCR